MSGHFEVYEGKAHQWRFRLEAGNGEIVAVGESYPTRPGAEQGAEAVKRAVADADVKVITGAGRPSPGRREPPRRTANSAWLQASSSFTVARANSHG
ncbi:YegP family protein [Streptomyces beijiangensis]|uniref:DUF1508 domain-containing protein n=1 Tax=Streptomyces beijiangensis TaxID=163361 RepID=A0A939F7G6_9ACTN|nr:DUF1508 domain-containing protein [Streptomyces beijiangensis]MBO0513745.1 DUF1508 domain-containing protein [Streptomyces beijiangensis]